MARRMAEPSGGRPMDCGEGDAHPGMPSQKRRCSDAGWPTPVLMPAIADDKDLPGHSLATPSSAAHSCAFLTQAAGRHDAGPQGAAQETLQAQAADPLSGALAATSGSPAITSDWRMILYQDRNMVLYNPKENPPLWSRRIGLDEPAGEGVAAASAGRCPLCHSTINARFSFAAQAYFDLLQSVFRSTRSSQAPEACEEADPLAESDLYRLLGVSRSANPDDIKRAYRKRSLRFHPDKNLCDPDAKLKFQKIAEAFTVLSDEQKRSKYDMSGVMDLDDFDVEQFMNMVNSAGRRSKAPAAAPEAEGADVGGHGDDADFADAAPTKGVECRWEVVHFTFVNIRAEKSRDAKITGVKESGSIFFGTEEEGEWVALADEPGFVMIRNDDQGTLLQRFSDASDPGFAIGDLQPISGDNNPFLLAPGPADVAIGAAVASEGGVEAEAAAAAALRSLPPGLLNTGYYARFFTEIRSLGVGSFGAVFLCRHVLDDLVLGDYAVKKVPVGDNKTWLRDMIREVKMFERLHHPNIVEYKHSWLELSRRSEFCPLVPFLFILMQCCDGGSLDDLLWHDGDLARPKTPPSVVQVWHFLLDILQGLQHLHRQGILHRDLKPKNVLLHHCGEGVESAGALRALLSDFGTATALGEAPTGVNSRGYTGTVEYTAPELLRGQDRRDYTEKSDMWSLGIVLYAMCFSSLPFHNDDPSALKELIQRFVEERRLATDDKAGVENVAKAAVAWLPPDLSGAQARARGGRLGSLRLVLAALLAIDAHRRPTATDLLENAVFRGQAARFAGRAPEQPAALQNRAASPQTVIDLTD